jgi:hypothetical protein
VRAFIGDRKSPTVCATVSEQGGRIPPDSEREFRRVRRYLQMRVPANEQRRVPIRDGSPRYRYQRVRESKGSRISGNEFQRHGIRAEGSQADARVAVNARFVVSEEVRKAATLFPPRWPVSVASVFSVLFSILCVIFRARCLARSYPTHYVNLAD